MFSLLDMLQNYKNYKLLNFFYVLIYIVNSLRCSGRYLSYKTKGYEKVNGNQHDQN